MCICIYAVFVVNSYMYTHVLDVCISSYMSIYLALSLSLSLSLSIYIYIHTCIGYVRV